MTSFDQSSRLNGSIWLKDLSWNRGIELAEKGETGVPIKMSDTLFEPLNSRPMTAIRIGPVLVSPETLDGAVRTLQIALRQRRFVKLGFANAHLVNQAFADPKLSKSLESFLLLPDGLGIDIAALLLHADRFPANLNGTDLIPHLLTKESLSLKVGLLGARPGVADRAAAALRKLVPTHNYEVISHGYFDRAEEDEILARIAASRPDMLLIAFGNPIQEQWIAAHLDARHCSIAAGVGALFDFLSGEVKRAPLWMRRLRLEWLFRVLQEPARLWQRYSVGSITFLARIMTEKLRNMGK